MKDFVHLHLHSEYSLLDGAIRIDEIADHLKSIGQNAAAITDHGVMCGCVEFYKALKEKGIKPIIGCEVYTSPRTRFDKKSGIDNSYGHLVLLAENEEGYHNLCRIVSKAWQEGFYIKPRVDCDLLKENSKGLICLSACLAGDIPSFILKGDMESAEKKALEYYNIFGKDNFYLELQNHGISEQAIVNDGLIKISEKLNIPLVCTNDAHYLRKEDADSQNILLCIQTARTVEEGSKMGFETKEFYVKTGDEMYELFSNIPSAVENTVRIAERCNFDFEFGKINLPAFKTCDKRNHFEILNEMVNEGASARYHNISDELKSRIEYELGVIKSMGYVDYFLIVSDFVGFAKKKGIPVGPGRGSAAGSVISYCLGITDVDPIKYDLLFERFLNPERVTMPDIDIDFCYERRQEVIDYVTEKYGRDNVCQIVTFGTMKARLVIRDVARALALPYSIGDTVAKLIPFEKDQSIASAVESVPKLKEMYYEDSKIKNLIDTAEKLEGMPRHASTHAAGVIITEKPVSEYLPLLKNDNVPVTQYPMGNIEQLGLLKMDFLGLRYLTVISDAEKLAKRSDPGFDIEKIDYEDQNVYKMLTKGKTTGLFQLESAGMRQVLMRLKP